jgi:hypothetical protein
MRIATDEEAEELDNPAESSAAELAHHGKSPRSEISLERKAAMKR